MFYDSFGVEEGVFFGRGMGVGVGKCGVYRSECLYKWVGNGNGDSHRLCQLATSPALTMCLYIHLELNHI